MIGFLIGQSRKLATISFPKFAFSLAVKGRQQFGDNAIQKAFGLQGDIQKTYIKKELSELASLMMRMHDDSGNFSMTLGIFFKFQHLMIDADADRRTFTPVIGDLPVVVRFCGCAVARN